MTAGRVLLVEDDERSAELIRLTLEPTEFELVRAGSLEEARVHIKAGLPDVILLDLRLPDGPGYVLASEVRAMPGGAGVHILAVSASVTASDRSHALESGCDDFIEKPISPRDLVTRLRRRQDERA